MYRSLLSISAAAVLMSPMVLADTSSDLLKGFDNEISFMSQKKSGEGSYSENTESGAAGFLSGFSGKLQQQIIYTPKDSSPHNDVSSLQSLFFLDYEHKFDNDFKFKINAKAYYDAIYGIRGRGKFSQDELDELQSEIELFDAYIEGSITDMLDVKVGRQVVVWGRSDTLRVTDVLNPLDNRRPGLQDIEYLRLPVTMAKLDYFIGKWRITPIAILEQRFSKYPPYGSAFYPLPFSVPEDEDYSDVTYALSIGGEFQGWDINFYAAHIYDDEGYFVVSPKMRHLHEKVNMFGAAANVVVGDWLFKTEVAYFDGLKYTMAKEKSFTRTDILLGLEYKGFEDTYILYDIVNRNIGGYDERLLNELNPLHKHSYQQAFRIRSEFMNATLTANYLITLYGEHFDEGGFQRAWVNYEWNEEISTTIGVVDYMGNSPLFETIKNNDMVFADISYSF